MVTGISVALRGKIVSALSRIDPIWIDWLIDQVVVQYYHPTHILDDALELLLVPKFLMIECSVDMESDLSLCQYSAQTSLGA